MNRRLMFFAWTGLVAGAWGCSSDSGAAPDGSTVRDGSGADIPTAIDVAKSFDSGTPDSATPDRGASDTGIVADAGMAPDSGTTADSGEQGDAPAGAMTFFVTSVGNGANGGNYEGLAGADAQCQRLAAAVGRGGKTWHAYMSTAPITDVPGGLVHARDRIGTGPWYNHAGVRIASSVGELHANPPSRTLMLTEMGGTVPTNEHDILTHSKPDGTAMDAFPENPSAPAPTCLNATSNDSGAYGWVGHVDWDNGATAPSWNSAHETECDQVGLANHAGAARLYCFAID
jgi:hypothetical protein